MGLRCMFGWHAEPVLECFERDARGTVVRRLKHQLAWRCPQCFRIVGKTELKPDPKLLRRLREQIGRRLRLVA